MIRAKISKANRLNKQMMKFHMVESNTKHGDLTANGTNNSLRSGRYTPVNQAIYHQDQSNSFQNIRTEPKLKKIKIIDEKILSNLDLDRVFEKNI